MEINQGEWDNRIRENLRNIVGEMDTKAKLETNRNKLKPRKQKE